MTSKPGSTSGATWLRVDGLRIRCLIAGSGGPPVLLLHGGGIDAADFSYKHAIRPLSSDHRVFAPDLPGYGGSDGADDRYTLDFYAGFLGRLMDALGLERASLVGLSLGGGAALGFALRSPERVDRLVLVDSYGLGTDIPWGRLGYLLVHAPLVNDLTYALLSRSRRMVRWSLSNLVHNRSAVDDALVKEAYRLVRKPGAGHAFRSFQRNEVGWRGLRTSYVDRLREVSAPTLIVHGANDEAVPVAWAHRAHELIAGSELRVIPRCGHWPPRERPEEFNRIVGEFLKR